MESYRVRHQKCVVPGCEDNFSKKHKFPSNDGKLFHKWVQQVNNPLLHTKTNEQIFKSYKVCDLHFSDTFKEPGTKRGLRKYAYPTINLVPGHLTSKEVSSDLYQPSQQLRGADLTRKSRALFQSPLPTLYQSKKNNLHEDPIEVAGTSGLHIPIEDIGYGPVTWNNEQKVDCCINDILLETPNRGGVKRKLSSTGLKTRRRLFRTTNHMLRSVRLIRQQQLSPQAKKLYRTVIGCKCNTCKNNLIACSVTSCTDFIEAREYKPKLLLRPGSFLVFLVSEAESHLHYLIPRVASKKNISQVLKLINCSIHNLGNDICDLLTRCCLYFWCRKMNRIASGRDLKFHQFVKNVLIPN